MFIEKLKKENKNYEEAIVNLKNLRNERTVCIEEGFEESQHHKSKITQQSNYITKITEQITTMKLKLDKLAELSNNRGQ